MATLTIYSSDCSGSPLYGYVYNWWAAIGDTTGNDISDKNLTSSDDWEVPDYLDWQALADVVDPDWTFPVDTIGRSLKSIGLTYWNDPSDPNLEGTDDVGFDGRGAGVRNHTDGSYAQQGTVLRMWRSEESAVTSDGMLAYLQYNIVKLGVPSSATTGNSIDKNHGCSIRLVNNSTTLSDGEYGTYIGNDGKIYLTVCIGTQEWIVTNLVETKWRDGTSIDQVEWDAAGDTEWINATSAKMSIP